MKDILIEPRADEKWHYAPQRGYIEYRSMLQELKWFESLIRHYIGRTKNIPDKELIPLFRLIPKPKATKASQKQQLASIIRIMRPSIDTCLRDADILSVAHISIPGSKKAPEQIDVLWGFFNEESNPRIEADRIQFLMDILDEAIGNYEASIRYFWRSQAWSPTYWIARLLTWPIRILAKVGVNVENEKTRHNIPLHKFSL
jgi:hypothetical protein